MEMDALRRGRHAGAGGAEGLQLPTLLLVYDIIP